MPDAPEQLEPLRQPVLFRVFAQRLVEPTARDQEQHRLHALERLHPLAAMVPLPADIEHAELLRTAAERAGHAHVKPHLLYTRRRFAAVQDVPVRRDVPGH